MLTLIGITIFVIAEFIFDYMSVGESTNWSIFYFASTYFSICLIAIDLIWNDNSKIIRYTAASFAIFFMILAIMELSFINVPFNEYIINVNDNKLRIILFGLLSIILIFISIMAWEKRRLKKLEK